MSPPGDPFILHPTIVDSIAFGPEQGRRGEADVAGGPENLDAVRRADHGRRSGDVGLDDGPAIERRFQRSEAGLPVFPGQTA
jgi:hypothetical protein